MSSSSCRSTLNSASRDQIKSVSVQVYMFTSVICEQKKPGSGLKQDPGSASSSDPQLWKMRATIKCVTDRLILTCDSNMSADINKPLEDMS